MWIPFNPNPKRLHTIDCTVRSICAVTGMDWYSVHDIVCARSRDLCDMPSCDRVWWSVLRDMGFDQRRMLDRCPDCYTVAEFAADNPHGIYVLGPHEHAVAVIDGNWWDTWDSGKTVPTYYFRRD